MNRLKVPPKLAVLIALSFLCALAVWGSFGRHLHRASSDIINETFYCAPRYVAFREYAFGPEQSFQGMARCDFGGLSFELPSAMADQPRLFRESPTSIWLVFEDRGRFMQIPLSSPALASMISTPPAELIDRTVPRLLATIAAVSSDDFSFRLTPSELRIYEWAIANRESVGLDGQSLDRYSARSSKTLDTILFSVDPNVSLSDRQIRSFLVWQAIAYNQLGLMHFGDSTEEGTEWINACATSVEFVPVVETEALAATDFAIISDDEILGMLKVGDAR